MKNKLNDNNLNLSGGFSVSGVGKRAIQMLVVAGCFTLGMILEDKLKVSEEIEDCTKKVVRAVLK